MAPFEFNSFVLFVAVDLVKEISSSLTTVTDDESVTVFGVPAGELTVFPGSTATTYTLLSKPVGTVIVFNGKTASPGFIPADESIASVTPVYAAAAFVTILSIAIKGSHGAYFATDI